jgi:predicted alpha/beta superfamily hydrolase
MRRAIFVLLIILSAGALNAQELVRLGINSKVLGEERMVLVQTPRSYGMAPRAYPVLYMTDGGAQLAHTVAVVDFLNREGRVPELILVGIGNTDRTRDLTPTHVEQTNFGRFPTSGGADRFLSFIETELIPYIEQNFRTQPYRAFAGHSFGGLFAMHALMTRPRLFNSVIAVSPTLTWDDHLINRRLPEFLKKNRDLNTQLVLTIGNEGADLDREFARFKSIMKSAPKGIEWTALRFDDEDHGSVVLPSHHAGLKKIFDSWRFDVRNVEPTQLMARARDHYARLSKRFGYAISIPENTMNFIGYRLMQSGSLAQAIEAFQANVAAYPKSPNVYDSLGEAYEREGSIDLAHENYDRAARLGKEMNDPNTQVYEQNRDRVAKEIVKTKT